MIIKVTGCNNCPFRFGDGMNLFCSYNINDDTTSQLVTVFDITNGSDFRTDLPHNCPITLNGGEITIKTKTE